MGVNLRTARAYTPYGYSKFADGRLGFNGEFHELATGLYPLGNGHRMYSPALLRFCSPDKLSPFGRGGLNRYAYCEADPVNWTDPTGKNRGWNTARFTMNIGTRLIAGGGFVWAAATSRDFISGFLATSKRALTRGPITPADFPEHRYNLWKNANKADKPFNNAVNGVNENLGSHGDGALSARQARHYTAATWSNDSNTTLHLHSTVGWGLQLMQTADPAAATGAAFNGAATLVSGALDHIPYKLGGILTTPDPVSAVSPIRK